jgi:dolichyl-diphosphooligosaccharide--protein glycosyltransferase
VPRSPPRRITRSTLALAVAVALGAVLRFLAWPRVFTDHGIRLAWDTDPLYHLLRAERFLAGGVRATWFDPSLNWPRGAPALWPPLWDVLVGSTARLVAAGAPARVAVERAGAILPPVLGILTLLLVAALSRALLGRDRVAGATFLAAVLPGHALLSSVGSADHHAAEVFLSCAVLWTFVRAWQAPSTGGRRGWSAAAAIAVAASFWNWPGSVITLGVPVLYAAAAHVALPEGDEGRRRIPAVLAASLGGAALLLAVTVAAWGEPGALARGGLTGVGGLHVAVVACGAAFGAALAAAERRLGPGRAWRRVAEVAAGGALPAAAAFVLLPMLREGLAHALATMGATDPVWAEIEEVRPLLGSGKYSVPVDLGILVRTFGLAMPAAVAAAWPLARRWREGGEARRSVLFLAAWAVPFAAIAFLRGRFVAYLTLALAPLAWEGLLFLGAALQARLWPERPRAALAAALVGLAAVLVPTAGVVPKALAAGIPGAPEESIAAMRWLAGQRPAPGREGVLSTWDLGHLVLYYAGKPVVGSPFGSDVGPDGMQDLARFDLARDPEEAAALLAARRIGWVALTDPMVNAVMDEALAGAPPYVRSAYDPWRGRTLEVGPEYGDLVAPRLFHFDGMGQEGRPVPPIDRLRLVYETPGQRLKIFAAVEGAALTVSGVRPGVPVEAAVRVRTNQGRDAYWSTGAVADGRGIVTLRLPYATGPNGAVEATPWVVTDGRLMATVPVAERDVVAGGEVVTDLARGGTAIPARGLAP